MRSKHCVLGGAGFIGSHLCDALLARGDEVVAFDNMSTGRRENVAHLLGNDGAFELLEADVTDASKMGWNGALFLHDHFDVIWNLACPASPPAYQRDPIGTMMTCVVGTKNALDLAKACGARLVQASTSEVYGDPLESPQHESYKGNVNPTGPRACYDEGKRAAEALCFDYRRLHSVDVRVARIFNTYGPRMRADDGRVVSNFVTQALRGERLTLNGDGSQTRSLCYVSDLVAGLVTLGTLERPLKRERFDVPINLGNSDECTLEELATQILRLTGAWCPTDGRRYTRSMLRDAIAKFVKHTPLPVDDPMRRKPDISRAQAELGWEPTITRADGLSLTIEHFRRIIEQEVACSKSSS